MGTSPTLEQKAARAAYMRQFREKNREAQRAYSKAYEAKTQRKKTDDYRASAREWAKQSYAKMPEKMIARSKAYYEANAAAVRAKDAEYRAANRETLRENYRAWKAANPGAAYAATRRWVLENPGWHPARRLAKENATPKWLTDAQLAEINGIYRKAKETGMEVDHIVPIKGRTVCGLHVAWNLQLLTKSENCRKGNRLLEIAA